MREQRRRDDARSGWSQAFDGHGPMRILLETGTESEWVAQALEAAGHEVIVADPNYAPMYGELRAHGQNGSPRCGGAGRGQSARLVSARRIGRRPAQRAMRQSAAESPAAGADAIGDGRAAAGAAAAVRAIGWRTGSCRDACPRAWRSWRCRRALAETLAPLRRMIDDADDRDRRRSMRGCRRAAAADPIVPRLQHGAGRRA